MRIFIGFFIWAVLMLIPSACYVVGYENAFGFRRLGERPLRIIVVPGRGRA